jgi:hypothetical protein
VLAVQAVAFLLFGAPVCVAVDVAAGAVRGRDDAQMPLAPPGAWLSIDQPYVASLDSSTVRVRTSGSPSGRQVVCVCV